MGEDISCDKTCVDCIYHLLTHTCKRVRSLPFLVSYQSLTVTSLFANTLAGTRTQRILRAKADFKQSTCVRSDNMCN